MSIGQTISGANEYRMICERDEALERLALYEEPGEIRATITIPYYDQPTYIETALCSAIGQTAGLLEVIVVDDGSPDGEARRLCEEHAAHGDPVRYVRVTNRGLPNARNTGLMLARGRAFVALDADDWIDPTFLEKLLPLIHDGYDVAFSGLQEHGTHNATLTPGCHLPIHEVTVEAEKGSNHLWYCAVAKTALLREVGGYNGRMIHGYEDWDLWIDLLQRGARLGGIAEPLFHYLRKSDSMLLRSAKMHGEIVAEMRRHGC